MRNCLFHHPILQICPQDRILVWQSPQEMNMHRGFASSHQATNHRRSSIGIFACFFNLTIPRPVAELKKDPCRVRNGRTARGGRAVRLGVTQQVSARTQLPSAVLGSVGIPQHAVHCSFPREQLGEISGNLSM